MDLKRTCLLVPIVVAVVLVALCFGRGQSNSAAAQSGASIPAPPLLREAVGASRCQFCHRSEVEGYARSAMAHSLRRAEQEPDGTVETPDAEITMHSSPTG